MDPATPTERAFLLYIDADCGDCTHDTARDARSRILTGLNARRRAAQPHDLTSDEELYALRDLIAQVLAERDQTEVPP